MAAKDSQALVSLQSWLETNNLLEVDASPETFKKGVAWFKRHIKDVPVFSPKNGIYFVNAKLASSAYEKHMKSLNGVLENKQMAALKLSAKNMGIRIAVRASVLKPKCSAEERRLFWASKEGCQLYNYCLQIVLLKKPALQPTNYVPCKNLPLPTILHAALRPDERLEKVCTDLNLNWEDLKTNVGKIARDKVGFISSGVVNAKSSFYTDQRNNPLNQGAPGSQSEDEDEAAESDDEAAGEPN